MFYARKNIVSSILIMMALSFCTTPADQRILTFYLFWIDSIPASAIAEIAGILEDSLGVRVKVGQGMNPPDSIWSETRHRYKAASMLKWIAQLQKANSVQYQLLMTDKDLGMDYDDEYLRGVHGLSVQGGQAGIISDYRLHQLGRPRDSVDYYLGKVALHEAGHMLGLAHCKTVGCIMESVEVKQHITSLGGFCYSCKKNISKM
jgi:archaemetzincin